MARVLATRGTVVVPAVGMRLIALLYVVLLRSFFLLLLLLLSLSVLAMIII